LAWNDLFSDVQFLGRGSPFTNCENQTASDEPPSAKEAVFVAHIVAHLARKSHTAYASARLLQASPKVFRGWKALKQTLRVVLKAALK
jgi:hypothetical protein